MKEGGYEYFGLCRSVGCPLRGKEERRLGEWLEPNPNPPPFTPGWTPPLTPGQTPPPTPGWTPPPPPPPPPPSFDR